MRIINRLDQLTACILVIGCLTLIGLGIDGEVTSAPNADATQVGRIIRVRSGAGVATSVKMCCLNSANAYEWVVLGTAS